MAKGVLGMPLLKGSSQVITTAIVTDAATNGLKAGVAVFETGTMDNQGLEQVQLAPSVQFAGITSTDYKVNPQSSEDAVAGIVKAGRQILVRVPTDYTITMGVGVGVNVSGEFINADDGDLELPIAAQWVSTELFQGIDQSGAEHQCGMIDLVADFTINVYVPPN
jgi:hypothetical protein